ncbi:hypothetical protein JOD55_000314 [Arcanobacterium pluranimalium]|nr:hypothetical protein [Arcanobacterium pluranimalium]MBM7824487.1 hypothetical protein [Arcanobacterium pluranimalium]
MPGEPVEYPRGGACLRLLAKAKIRVDFSHNFAQLAQIAYLPSSARSCS